MGNDRSTTVTFTVLQALTLAALLTAISFSPDYNREQVNRVQRLLGVGLATVTLTADEWEEVIAFFDEVLPRVPKADRWYDACEAIGVIYTTLGIHRDKDKARTHCVCNG